MCFIKCKPDDDPFSFETCCYKNHQKKVVFSVFTY